MISPCSMLSRRTLRQLNGHLQVVLDACNLEQSLLGGCFKDFFVSPLFGADSHFDSYFSDGLKPPTRMILAAERKNLHRFRRKSKVTIFAQYFCSVIFSLVKSQVAAPWHHSILKMNLAYFGEGNSLLSRHLYSKNHFRALDIVPPDI